VSLPAAKRKRLEALLTELRWRNYGQNPDQFFSECVWVPSQGILDVDRQGKVLFDLFPYQRSTLETFLNRRYVIVLKARQLGLTTLADAYALWLLMFRPGSNILLVSKDQPTADKALDLLKFMYRFLPGWMGGRLPELEVDSAREMVWRHATGLKSRIVSRPATKTVGAGETATLVMWDEAALASYQDESLRSLMPTTDAGGSMIVFSTARGGHNTFARLYRDAEAGRSEFAPIFHPWSESRLMNKNAGTSRKPDMGLYEGRRLQMADKPWQFYAEYPSDPDEAFRQSGRTRFQNLPPVEEFDEFPLRGRLIEDGGVIQFVNDPEGLLRLAYSLEGAILGPTVVAVDPSEGVGGDYTAMSAGYLDDNGVPVRVAFWHDNLTEPAKAAYEASLLGRFLSFRGREALMVVEKQGGFGETIIHELRENHRYRNLYMHTYTGHRKRRREQTYGMPMTASRRPLVVDALAKWLNFGSGSQVMEGVDRTLRLELGAFVVTDSGRVEADVGMHDDLVMSTAIMAYVLSETLRPAVSGSKGDMPARVTTSGTMSLTSIWEEAEDQMRKQSRQDRKYSRKLARSMRR
jgi:hypothetical protein